MIVNAAALRSHLRGAGVGPDAIAKIRTQGGYSTTLWFHDRAQTDLAYTALRYAWTDSPARVDGGPFYVRVLRQGAENVEPMPPAPEGWAASSAPLRSSVLPYEPLGDYHWAWLVYAAVHLDGKLSNVRPPVSMHFHEEHLLVRAGWFRLVELPGRRYLVAEVSDTGHALVARALAEHRAVRA